MTQISPEARKVLLGMKEQLAAGWIQDSLFGHDDNGDLDGRACLLGAGLRASGATPIQVQGPVVTVGSEWIIAPIGDDLREVYAVPCPLREVLRELSLLAVGYTRLGDYRGLVGWNDADDRTHEEVVALIDAALAATAPDRAREEITV